MKSDPVIQRGAGVGFLLARQRVIAMSPILPAGNAGYVWKRVFLRGKGIRH